MTMATDLDAPLPSAPAGTPWGALASTLSSKGLLLSNAAADGEEPANVSSCADLLGPTARTDVGSEDAPPPPPPLLLVLVSGSWCAPCRNFTPVLSSCDAEGNGIKVIFCSADQDADSFREYYAKMPPTWSALPFDEDGEDERDELIDALGAHRLPCLLVMDPRTGRVVESNAVHAVRAGGSEGFGALAERWRAKAKAAGGGDDSARNASAATDAADRADDDDESDDPDSLELTFHVPAPPDLICRYFRERLVSPDLPDALADVVLSREAADSDPAATALAEAIGGGPDETEPGSERWIFRTSAPALPGTSYGSSLGIEARAVERWDVVRDAADGTASRAVCTIENETGRTFVLVRERIVMEPSPSGSGNGGTDVRKTLDLDGVPRVARGAFRRRWKRESELIFHALLGTCDRKKGTAKK
ncbi:hypothetical protein ACHAWF_006350 [Thalassiosira exigua]